jgi:undecaprenyl-diphosphatase
MQRLLELDARLSARLGVAERPGLLRSLAILFGHSGDSWFWLAGLLLLALLRPGSWRAWAIAYILAILATALVVMAIKFSVRRARPAGEWGQMYRRTDPHSFPSGHAARAMLLGVLALATGPAWLAALLVVWAPLVGLARIATGLHYVSDVVVGWLLGAGMALAWLGFYDFSLLL